MRHRRTFLFKLHLCTSSRFMLLRLVMPLKHVVSIGYRNFGLHACVKLLLTHAVLMRQQATEG